MDKIVLFSWPDSLIAKPLKTLIHSWLSAGKLHIHSWLSLWKLSYSLITKPLNIVLMASLIMKFKMSQLIRLWYLSHRRPAKAQAHLKNEITKDEKYHTWAGSNVLLVWIICSQVISTLTDQHKTYVHLDISRYNFLEICCMIFDGTKG